MKNIVNLVNLTLKQKKILLSIYKNCKTYKVRYKYPGLFQNELLWPETLKEYNWIKNNILSHFNLTINDVAPVPYLEESSQYRDKKINLPYESSTINFSHYYPGDYAKSHNDKDFFSTSFSYNAKINIPVINTHFASIQFEKSGESSCYPSPILVNTFAKHKVIGMGKKLLVHRAFLQIRLKKNFSFYYNKLKWNLLQENFEKTSKQINIQKNAFYSLAKIT